MRAAMWATEARAADRVGPAPPPVRTLARPGRPVMAEPHVGPQPPPRALSFNIDRAGLPPAFRSARPTWDA
jgi:hypothetical protein